MQAHLKGQFAWKWKFCLYLLALVSFQTCMIFSGTETTTFLSVQWKSMGSETTGVFLDFIITYFCVSQKSGLKWHGGNDNKIFIFRWISLWKELSFSLSSFRNVSLESDVPCCKHSNCFILIYPKSLKLSCTALSRLSCVGRWFKLDIFGINLYMRQLC